MEHRKRHFMQHKTEVSLLVKLAMKSKKHSKQAGYQSSGNMLKALASEAMKSAKQYDRAVISKRLVAEPEMA